jgi:hypothetical protein
MSSKIEINAWPNKDGTSGAKRANLDQADFGPDWWVGYGKDTSCQFEGTWWDMICFARNVLANENTKLCAPEFHKPEWVNNNYCGEDMPYRFVEPEGAK